MNRRRFLGTGLSVGALTIAAGCGEQEDPGPRPKESAGGGKATAAAKSGFTLQMRFTGLFMFELTPDKKEMMVSFIDEQKVEVEEPHTSLMLVRLSDDAYKWPDEYKIAAALADPPGLPLRAPQIIRVGSEVYGMWGIHDRVVWIHSAHDRFYTADPAPAFSFPEEAGKWKGLNQFLNMKDVLSPPAGVVAANPHAPVPQLMADRVKSRIRLTRGNAIGEVPISRCEREREYGIIKAKNEPERKYRSYASEFTVSYEVPGSEVVLGVAGRGRHEINGQDALEPDYAVVTLRGKPGSTVAVSFSNCPTTHHHLSEHFPAVSRVMGVQQPRTVHVREGVHCRNSRVSPYAVPLALSGVHHKARIRALGSTGSIKGTPPEPGCVPSFIVRKGDES